MPFRFKVGLFCVGFGLGGGGAVAPVVVVPIVLATGGADELFLTAPDVFLPKLTSVVALEAAALGAPGGGGGLAFGFIREASFFCFSKISRSLALNLLLEDDIVSEESDPFAKIT